MTISNPDRLDRRSEPEANNAQRTWRRQKRAALIVGLLLLLIIAGCGQLAIKADQVRKDLTVSLVLASQLREDIVNGDVDAAATTVSALQQRTSNARSSVSDPVWRVATAVPMLGANFSAVSEIAVSADDIVQHAVTPLVHEASSLNWQSIAPVEGRVDLAPIEAAAPSLSLAVDSLGHSYERLAAIDSSQLLDVIAEPLDETREILRGSRDSLAEASAVAQVLPGMLGSDGNREYLVLIQNSAEIRATGGIPGALAVISANEGHVELTAQGSASQMPRFDPAILLDEDQAEIYSTRIGRFMQSVNLTPDFPTAARTASAMWERHSDHAHIDGVVALDPVVLAHILEATGPVKLSFDDAAVTDLLTQTGLPTSLTSDNVVQTLLSDVYSAIDEPRLQDAYFAAVASEVFDALASGAGEATGLVQALSKSVSEGRIHVWSVDDSEQNIIAPTDVGGSITGPGSGGAAFGAYFNDGTGAKMDFYVERTVQLRQRCTADGYLQYTVIATLFNKAPTDAADSLPPYVTGDGAFGVPPGTVQTNFVAYGPDQAQLQTARVNGDPSPLGSHRHGNRPVGVLTTRLDPGESITVEIDFTNVVQRSEPTLDVTPTIQPVKEVLLPLIGTTSCG